jgi:CheY-like chemotaxis protein
MIKVKILIVDDEEDFCLIMKSYFAKKGYDVLMAFDLKNGLQMVRNQQPDILFLDSNLPDGEGWQHTDELLQEFPSLKIHLISAYRQKTDEYNSHPNVKVWEKPISVKSLEQAFALSA